MVLQFRAKRPVEVSFLRRMRQSHLDTCFQLGFEDDLTWDLVSITDEICSNIAEHSDAAWLEWEMFVDESQRAVHLIFRDNGSAFNPKAVMLSTDRADPVDYIEDGRHLGLALVGKLAAGVEYKRLEDNVNELTIHKTLN